MSAQIISKTCIRILPCVSELYHRFKQTFRSRSRSSLIDPDSDSESCLVATTPGDSGSDSGSDSDSAPLTITDHMRLLYVLFSRAKFHHVSSIVVSTSSGLSYRTGGAFGFASESYS